MGIDLEILDEDRLQHIDGRGRGSIDRWKEVIELSRTVGERATHLQIHVELLNELIAREVGCWDFEGEGRVTIW